MKLLIFYLTDNRRHYTFPHFVNLLKGSQKKDQWKLIVLTHSRDTSFYSSQLQGSEIQNEVVRISFVNNYISKVKFALQKAKENNIPYMMKCDNDIFFTGRTLDYMIDNLSALEDGEHLTLGPTLSSGIPGVEHFMKQFLSEEEQEELKKRFLLMKFESSERECYGLLNKYTVEASSWDPDGFFELVKSSPYFYKGVHPIRHIIETISYLNDCILKKKEQFYEEKELSLISDKKSPYLCNSVFCIKTDIYESIINDDSLYVDPYEEVPVNRTAWNTGKGHLFVRNGFAIHMYYNTVANHLWLERDFCNKFFLTT
jgi:hypothetical protein